MERCVTRFPMQTCHARIFFETSFAVILQIFLWFVECIIVFFVFLFHGCYIEHFVRYVEVFISERRILNAVFGERSTIFTILSAKHESYVNILFGFFCILIAHAHVYDLFVQEVNGVLFYLIIWRLQNMTRLGRC